MTDPTIATVAHRHSRATGRATSRRSATLVVGAALLACSLIAGPAAAAEKPQPKSVKVQVKNRKPYTNTGVSVHTGETVNVRVTGSMQFGGGAGAATTPNGLTWSTSCTSIADAHGHRAR